MGQRVYLAILAMNRKTKVDSGGGFRRGYGVCTTVGPVAKTIQKEYRRAAATVSVNRNSGHRGLLSENAPSLALELDVVSSSTSADLNCLKGHK